MSAARRPRSDAPHPQSFVGRIGNLDAGEVIKYVQHKLSKANREARSLSYPDAYATLDDAAQECMYVTEAWLAARKVRLQRDPRFLSMVKRPRIRLGLDASGATQ